MHEIYEFSSVLSCRTAASIFTLDSSRLCLLTKMINYSIGKMSNYEGFFTPFYILHISHTPFASRLLPHPIFYSRTSIRHSFVWIFHVFIMVASVSVVHKIYIKNGRSVFINDIHQPTYSTRSFPQF